MKCENVQELLSAYIDEMCSDEDKKEIEKHLEHCEECRKEYNILKSIIKDINSIEDVEAPESLHKDIMNKVSKAHPQRKKYRYKKWLPSGIAAGFVLIIVLSIIGFSTLRNWFLTNSTDSSYEKSEATQIDEESINENDVNVQYEMAETYDFGNKSILDENSSQVEGRSSKDELETNSVMMDSKNKNTIEEEELTCKQNTTNSFVTSNDSNNITFKMSNENNSENINYNEKSEMYNKEENIEEKNLNTQSKKNPSNNKIYIIIFLIIFSLIDIIILVKTKK